MMDNKDNDLGKYIDEQKARLNEMQKKRKAREKAEKEAERKAEEEAERKITEEQRNEMIASRLAENSLHEVFPGSTYVNYDGIKRFNKSLGNFKKKVSEFNKKHRKAVVRAELAAIIATAMLSLYNSGRAIKRQIDGREHIKYTVKKENEEIFDGLLLTSSGNLIYVDGFTMTSRPADENEIKEALAGKYDASVISIALSDYKIKVDGSSFLGEWVAADKAAGEAYKANEAKETEKNGESKASLNDVSGRSR